MDHWLHHPGVKTPILDWWAGAYDAVFIALTPFCRIRRPGGIGDDGSPYETLCLSQDQTFEFYQRVKTFGEPVTWASVHQAFAPEVPQDIAYRAIWLSAVAGFQPRAGIALQHRLADYCEAERLYLPEGDNLPAILHPHVQRFLTRFGSPTVTALDEFRTLSIPVPLTALAPDHPIVYLPDAAHRRQIAALHLADPGVLMTWGFDDAAGLIAMTAHARALAHPEDFFEGSYARPDTYSDVFNPVDFFERDPVKPGA